MSERILKNKNNFQRRLLKEARKDAKHIAQILGKRFNAEKVILFGSLAKGRQFDMASDIDIAVKGIGDKYLMAYGYCLGLSRFNLDIRAYEDMPLKLRKRIEREGKCLYEKKRKRKKRNN